MPRRSALLIVAAALAAGCTAPAPVGSPAASPASSPVPAASTAATGVVAPSASAAVSSPSASSAAASAGASPSTMASESTSVAVDPAAGTAAVEAARRLLEADGASVTMAVERTKGDGQPETLISGDGIVDPRGDRARMAYDLTPLFASPGHSPAPLERVALAWDADNLWGRPVGGDAAWETASRAEAAETGGLMGRLPREVVGLLELVAASDPAGSQRLADADVAGTPARHVLVPIPLEDAAGAGVPADTPTVDALRQAYGIDAIPIEVWLVEGEVRRIGYSLARDKAPYGGPDRTTVTYDWTDLGRPADLTLPPAP